MCVVCVLSKRQTDRKTHFFRKQETPPPKRVIFSHLHVRVRISQSVSRSKKKKKNSSRERDEERFEETKNEDRHKREKRERSVYIIYVIIIIRSYTRILRDRHTNKRTHTLLLFASKEGR